MTTTLYLFNFIFIFFFTIRLISNSSTQQRIYCVIKTFGKNLATRALTIHQTWARRCDKHIFLTATNLTKWNNISLPILNLYDVSDNYIELSIKLMMIHMLLWKIYVNYFIILKKPLAFGHLFAPKNGAPNHLSGGAGYVINTVALQRMLPNLQTSCAQWYVPGMEDVYVSRCLQYLNVSLNGAIDGYHHRFYPLEFLTMHKMDIPKWFSDYNTLKNLIQVLIVVHHNRL
ncbi:unnamed protein product, partial [Rotaria sp. Silwood2]